MLDEYVHMVSEGAGFGLSEDKNHQVHELMIDAFEDSFCQLFYRYLSGF